MSNKNFKRADEVEVHVSGDGDLPSGWEKTHE